MANINISQALYFNDPYCHEFNAAIIESIPQTGGGFAITLDKTYFYPIGGGQDHDIGTICDSRVISVERDEASWLVRHIVEDSLEPGPALCKIDWQHRLRNMQHHSGQHLLTQCILRLYGYKTISANINGYTPSTLDVEADQLLSDIEQDEAEELANQIIYENRMIKTYFVDEDNIEKIPLRRPPKVSEYIRIVEIDGYDYSACGGTHCTRTGEIGIIKVLKNERINNKTRVYFIAGYQAIHQFRSYHNTIKNLAIQLNINLQDLSKTVINLSESSKNMQKELRRLRHEKLVKEAYVLVGQAEMVNDVRLIQSTFSNRPVNELRTLADQLRSINDIVAQLTSYDGKRLSIIIACGKDVQVGAKEVLYRLLSFFDGKGGGDDQIAQGGGVINPKNLEILLREGNEVIQQMLK